MKTEYKGKIIYQDEPCVVCGANVKWKITFIDKNHTISKCIQPCPNKCLAKKPNSVSP